MVIITNLSTLLPLPFLGWLPATDPKATEQSSNDFAPSEAPVHNSGGLIESNITPNLVPEFAINRTAGDRD